LVKYKETLLANLDQIDEEEPALVEIFKIEFVWKDREEGNIELNFKEDEEVKKADEFVLKEGATFNIRLTFKVHNDIVYGLKFWNIVKKLKIQVEKEETVVGTFAPTKEAHVVDLPETCAPEGFFKRGSYKGKAMLIDSDGMVHMQFKYPFKIGKKWK
jgi:Rho GDP-dissociation inhibitor